MQKHVLAIDLGASSGRAILGQYRDGQLGLGEVHRFPNDPVAVGGELYWDFLRLFHEIKQGLRHAGRVDSAGIDTWAVDYGLLDGAGRLLANPYHYRDRRTDGIADRVYESVPARELYARTGIQYAPFNTVFQLCADLWQRPETLKQARHMLLLPDLIGYYLTGQMGAEYTNASTTALLGVHTRGWDRELCGRLSLPYRLFLPLRQPGSELGVLTPALQEELLLPAVPILSVASHDTASAVAALPLEEGEECPAYISCGTWSLFGTELPAPLANEEARALNFTNEGGVNGTVRFLKNIMGSWLIQESRRQWEKEGHSLSFSDLEELAQREEPYRSFIDVDDPVLIQPGDIPSRIKSLCARSGQPVPEGIGQVTQCIYSSLAMKYRLTLDQLGQVTGRRFPLLHMIGGGIQSKLLCQMTADCTAIPVEAGPVEATALGNIAVQLIALRALPDLAAARRCIRRSFPVARYLPRGDTLQQKIRYLQYQKAVLPPKKEL